MAVVKQGDVEHGWVDAAPFRAHLRYLMSSGSLSAEDVATIAGISPRLAERLLNGHGGRVLRRISPETGRQLMRVTGPDARSVAAVRIPARGARLRLHRLLRAGWTVAGLAEHLRASTVALTDLAAGSPECPLLLAIRLTALSREMPDLPRATQSLPKIAA